MKKELENSTWLGLNYFNKLANGIVFYSILAKGISLSEFGLFTYVFTIFSLVATLSALGLNNFVYIKISSGKYNNRSLINKSLKIQFYTALILLGSVFLLYMYSNNEVFIYLLIACFALVFKPLELYKLELDAQLQSKSYFKYDVIIPIVFMLLKIGSVFYLGETLIFLFLLYAIEAAILGLIYYRISLKLATQNENESLSYMSLIKNSLPILLASSVFIVYSKVDQLMIFNILGTEQQGIYSAALKLAEGWYFLFNAIIISFFAVISKYYYSNKEMYLKTLAKLSLTCNLLCYLAIIFVLIFSDSVIEILFGLQYQEASIVLKIMIFQSLIISASYITFRILLLEGLQKLSMLRAGLGLIVNIGLNFLLIPIYGITGAAFATIISHFIALFLSNFIFKKTRYIFKYQIKSMFLMNIKLLKSK